MIKYSIIIPTYNHFEEALSPCLKSILEFTDLAETEVIVVANGCQDSTVEACRSVFPWVKLIDFKNPLGYPKAVNKGILLSRGEFLILLNNDTILLEQKNNDWIKILKKPFERKEVGITGPLMGYNGQIKENFLIFFCVMIKREVLSRIGLLDEVFSPGAGEDTAFCIEARKEGFEIVQVPEKEELILDNVNNRMVGSFPIFHHGELTVHNELKDEWIDILERNSTILIQKYGKE